MNKGLSLLEILVVVSVFAILGILVTQSVVLTLRGSRKSESQIRVRENVNYALSIMERQLRNADSITLCEDGTSVQYTDNYGNPASFSCVNDYIASGSARLTSSEVGISNCSITCSLDFSTSSTPPYVDISVSAFESASQGVEGAAVTANTKVYLRTY